MLICFDELRVYLISLCMCIVSVEWFLSWFCFLLQGLWETSLFGYEYDLACLMNLLGREYVAHFLFLVYLLNFYVGFLLGGFDTAHAAARYIYFVYIEFFVVPSSLNLKLL